MIRPKKTACLNIRLTPNQKRKIEIDAMKEGVTITNYLLSLAITGIPKMIK